MQRMIADKPFPYLSRDLKVGEMFDAEDGHVNIFARCGQAHLAQPVQEYQTRTQEYQTRVMVAEHPRRRGRPRKQKGA